MLRDFVALLRAVLRFAVAVVAGVLPRRCWPTLEDRIPVARAALVSAIATVAVAATLGVPAFFRHSQASADRAVETMLQSTGWHVPAHGGPAPSSRRATATWLTSYLAFLSFAFLTPVGLLSVYLALSGTFRAVSTAVDEPRGDPLLTAVDAGAQRLWSRRAARRAALARERMEGPEVRDRLVPGLVAGFAGADYVVVASRRKAGWTPGTFVITSEKWYRLGVPVERRMPGGLRTLYPLTELHDHEVLRRGLPYELPPLSGPFSKTE